ncbi:MAG TPA: hypothetical protein VK911_04260 [Vicinamibacterales bacterium]|nr:hypothetical protein [Vicinamibacterales bacterium]
MADIDIVPKQRSYTWLWILLALVILAVLWWAFAGGGDTAEVSPTGAIQPALDQLAGLIGGLSRSA